MSTRTIAETLKTQKASPVVATLGEYEGKETLSVGPENGSFRQNMTAGLGKWRRLFSLDAEQDANLLNVLQFVVERLEPEEVKQVVEAVDAFVEQYLDRRDGYLKS